MCDKMSKYGLTEEEKEEKRFLKEVGASLYFAYVKKRDKVKKEEGYDFTFQNFDDFVYNAIDETD